MRREKDEHMVGHKEVNMFVMCVLLSDSLGCRMSTKSPNKRIKI